MIRDAAVGGERRGSRSGITRVSRRSIVSNTLLADIAIIGGGLSGTLAAANLLRLADKPTSIILVERSEHVGRGIAYNAHSSSHLLNVMAGGMSAWPDDPDHLLRWVQTEGRLRDADRTTFLPRVLYGEYIGAALREAERSAGTRIVLTRVNDEAVGITISPEGARIQLRNGDVRASKVVLAMGNFPPGDPWVPDPTFYASSRYYGSGWLPEAVRDIDGCPDLLLIGSGLTMLDVLNSLAEAQYHGMIHVISRHGLLPQVHELTTPPCAFLDPAALPKTVRELVRLVRAEIDSTAAHGLNWRPVVDALRPVSPAIWQGWNDRERRRYLRHVRSHWEVSRHRAPRQSLATAERLIAEQRLQLHAGRLQRYDESSDGVGVTYRLRHSTAERTIQVGRVINCTGPCTDYRRLRHPLIVSLLEQRLVRQDSLLLGLDVAPTGAIVGAAGDTSEVLYTLGPPRRGSLWETTAVREIRQQAADLASHLLGTT